MGARQLLLAAVLVAAATGCAGARTVTAGPSDSPSAGPTSVAVAPTVQGCPRASSGTLVVAGRPVLRSVPAGSRRPPLVMALAGYDQTRQDLDRVSHLVDRGQAQGVEVVLLQGTGRIPSWHYQPGQAQDVRFARDVLAVLRPCVDLHRLVLLGFSDGGLMAMRIGCALGPGVRDLVLLSASVAPEQGCRLPGSVLAVHGTDDPFDPYGGNDRGIPPARSAISAWATAAGCARVSSSSADRDVDVRSYPPCSVSLTTLEGGGHTWPDGEPSANPHAGPVFHGYDLTGLLLRLATA